MGTLANVVATIIAALLTALFGFYTARLTARVQERATDHTAHNDENERAWHRAEKGDADADRWRAEWAKEFELRCRSEARIVLLEGRISALESAQSH